MQICIILSHFLGTLTNMGPTHWIGVQTWLRSSHEGKWWWPPKCGSFVVTLLMQICITLRHFLGKLTDMGPIHWVGVQTWLWSRHEGKWRWPPRGGSFFVTLFDANLHHFAPFFGQTDRYGSYTLGRCRNLAEEQPRR